MAPKGSSNGKGKARAKMPTTCINRRLSLVRDGIMGSISEHICGLIRILNVCGTNNEMAWDLFYVIISLDPVMTRPLVTTPCDVAAPQTQEFAFLGVVGCLPLIYGADV
jgi:hypothetical protein